MKYLLFSLITLGGFFSTLHAQSDLDLSLSAIKTEQKNAAIGFAFQYLKPYLGVETQKNFTNSSKWGSYVVFTPEATLQDGTSDAFSQIMARLTGYYCVGKLAQIPGSGGSVGISNSSVLHIFPFSAGAETSSDFHFVNAIGEVGYAPYYQFQTLTNISEFLKLTQVGFFLQGGYKSLIDSANTATDYGGKTDESKEDINSNIFRFKALCTIDTRNFFRNSSNTGLGLTGKGIYWRDFVNGENYYQLDARIRLYLSANKFFDIIYQKGSGAPNFNIGDQWGTALTVRF